MILLKIYMHNNHIIYVINQVCFFSSCQCLPGFTGKNCSENINDCKSHACLNGATCVDGPDSYSCMCPPGFSGRFCEIAPVLDIVMPNSYARAPACRQHQCQNNAVCYQPSGATHYMCKCAPGQHARYFF